MDITAKSIIIADDEPVFRLDVGDMLLGLGFNVLGEASDGFDAVELCKKYKPDIALLDIKMPVFDGLYAATEIMENNLADCVVFLTAYSDDELIRCANKIGVTGYLVKPVEERLLKPTIEVAFSAAERLKAIRNEAKKDKEKLFAKNIIDRAKAIIAKERNILESEAYKYIQQIAMSKRCTMKHIAEIIIKDAKNVHK